MRLSRFFYVITVSYFVRNPLQFFSGNGGGKIPKIPYMTQNDGFTQSSSAMCQNKLVNHWGGGNYVMFCRSGVVAQRYRRRTCDHVADSIQGWALLRNDCGQVVHTEVTKQYNLIAV